MAEYEDESFQGYQVTTIDPGITLILFTVVTCMALMLLAYSLAPSKTRLKIQESVFDTRNQISKITRGSTSNESNNTTTDTEDIEEDSADIDILVERRKTRVTVRKGLHGKKKYGGTPTSIIQLQKESNKRDRTRRVQTRLKTLGLGQTSAEEKQAIQNVTNKSNGDDDSGKLQFEDFFKVFVSDLSNMRKKISPKLETFKTTRKRKGDKAMSDSFIKKDELKDEIKEVLQLAGPWTVTSFLSCGSELIVAGIISHFIGNAAMICYTSVWFFIGVATIAASGVYGSCYKLVNSAMAANTEDSHYLAGNYIQLTLICSTIIVVPMSILLVYLIDIIMVSMGYGMAVISTCQTYALIAVIHNFIETLLGTICCILDIDGHAKYNSMFEFWEEVGSIVATIVFVHVASPTLVELGIFHFCVDMLLEVLFFYITYQQKGWFDKIYYGLFDKDAIKNHTALFLLIKKSIPLIFDEIGGEIEWFLLTMLAIYQGPAESVTWILLRYLWYVIEVAPESFAEAAGYRVSHHLSKGNMELAQALASRSLVLSTIFATLCSAALVALKTQIAWLLSLDETLEEMLMEVIPYVALTQPMITIGMTASCMNEALCMSHFAAKAMFSATVLVTVPIGLIMTYALHYNVEGLASAVCIGYTTAGIINLVMYSHADWRKGMAKNQKVTGVLETQTEEEIEIT